MYKRDLITAEIEKLALVLARIMGLKVELKLKEAEDLFNETLLNSFGLERSLLLNVDIAPFSDWLETSQLNAEQLNSLGDFLFSDLDFEKNPINAQLFAQKLNLVYQCLADKHQTVHLINMGRQKYIQQYI
jgi:hypothetical protein